MTVSLKLLIVIKAVCRITRATTHLLASFSLPKLSIAIDAIAGTQQNDWRQKHLVEMFPWTHGSVLAV